METQTATTEVTTLEGIAELCKTYTAARERLADTTEDIRADQRRALRRRLHHLKARVAEVSVARDRLREAIAENPELFERPRTRALEGVKVGYRKQPGRIECDEERAIARIRKLQPDREADLVRVRESLVRSALKNLDAKTLASIGVTVVEVDDQIVIAAANDDLDKLVDALLSEDDRQEG